MASITVVHRGIGLWVACGAGDDEYWELLFPAAEDRLKDVNDPKKGYLPHHDPRLVVAEEHLKKDQAQNDLPNIYDLRGCSIDLRKLAVRQPTASLEQAWIPSLDYETGSAVDKLLKSEAYVPGVLGRVMLPKGILAPAIGLAGPLKWGDRENLFTPFAVAWTAALKPAEGPTRSIEIVTRGATISVPLHGDSIRLDLQNLSVLDRDVSKDRKIYRPDSDEDFGAHYLLTQSTPRKEPVLRWDGTLPTPALMLDMRGAIPEHPCSPARVGRLPTQSPSNAKTLP